MEPDIFAREEIYRKENEKLEIRTKELLQKVEDVMRIQDNLAKDSAESKSVIQNMRGSSVMNPNKYDDNEKKVYKNKQMKEAILDNDKLPKCVNEMGKKGMTHFFRAQVNSLQNENEKLQNECKKRTDELKKLEKENLAIKEEKEKWFLQYSAGKNLTSKFEKQISTVNSKLQTKDNEINSLKKELDHCQNDLKSTTAKLCATEVRLNRAQEETEKSKSALKLAKQNEKDLQDSYRKQIHDLEATVKCIEKHKSELLNGFKKQKQLIDNLKEQKINLENTKLSEISERDFMRILDWKPGTELDS